MPSLIALAAILDVLFSVASAENADAAFVAAVLNVRNLATYASTSPNAKGHLPEIEENVEALDVMSYDIDLTHTAHKALHAAVVTLDAVLAA